MPPEGPLPVDYRKTHPGQYGTGRERTTLPGHPQMGGGGILTWKLQHPLFGHRQPLVLPSPNIQSPAFMKVQGQSLTLFNEFICF